MRPRSPKPSRLTGRRWSSTSPPRSTCAAPSPTRSSTSASTSAGTLNLLEAARQTEARRFVLASTGGAIYGEGAGRPLPLDEQAECRPDAPYGQSKYAAEGYCRSTGASTALSAVALRLGNVYGSRQDPLGEAGVVAIFCGALLGGGTPRVFGDGHQTRDYVYVGDVVEAFLAGAASEAAGRTTSAPGSRRACSSWGS